jgi:hypothetical protein
MRIFFPILFILFSVKAQSDAIASVEVQVDPSLDTNLRTRDLGASSNERLLETAPEALEASSNERYLKEGTKAPSNAPKSNKVGDAPKAKKGGDAPKAKKGGDAPKGGKKVVISPKGGSKGSKKGGSKGVLQGVA